MIEKKLVKFEYFIYYFSGTIRGVLAYILIVSISPDKEDFDENHKLKPHFEYPNY